ncbi:hypothetical protein BC833DRAFT_579055 [Globomyces pollinis-pini]|nr:hypothetical protein BC833DRAFT_579055 [Globomyces pollinis-pini]
MVPFINSYQRLSYGNVVKHVFPNREFSFTLPNDAYLRFKSFKDIQEFKTELTRLVPIKIDIGAVYNIKPKDKKSVHTTAFVPLERELVFDIDMTDYDDIRTCCKEANICTKCWGFMTVAIKVLHRALEEDFGFKNILWVYSGRRGVHAWVCDERARQLPAEARRGIVNYLELLKGGEHQARKVNIRGGVLHPSLNRALGPCANFFGSTMLKDMGVLESKEQWSKVLAIIPDESYRKQLDREWTENPSLSSMQKWDQLRSMLGNSKKPSLEHLSRDIIFQYSYPRLDSNVSIGLNHLLKSPFCVHPKTGRICIPIDPRRCDEFDPFDVPTLDSLFETNDANDALQKHFDYFKTFLEKLKSEILVKLRDQRLENEKTLEF